VADEPAYLSPYLSAARRHLGGFASLLWASPDTQAARFGAIARLANPAGKTILDVGCGRADLVDYLAARTVLPADYTGIEAVPELLDAARKKERPGVRILAADFVQQPAAMFVGADVVIISGALNTLDTPAFYTTIRRSFDAAAEALVFNFLDSPLLAAASYLTWHKRDEVLELAFRLSRDSRVLSDYLDGDSTIAIFKEESSV
jgi:SAM-dependent methyltransferase